MAAATGSLINNSNDDGRVVRAVCVGTANVPRSTKKLRKKSPSSCLFSSTICVCMCGVSIKIPLFDFLWNYWWCSWLWLRPNPVRPKKRGVEKNKEMKSSLVGDFREKKTKKKKIVGVVMLLFVKLEASFGRKKAKNSVKKQQNKGL